MKNNVTWSEDFINDATKYITNLITSHQNESDSMFVMSLCGGTTPSGIYSKLSQDANINWSNVIITFGDERAVPPDDNQSNYKMVKESLLDNITIPSENVIRIQGELTPSQAAEKCEKDLRRFSNNLKESEIIHDLILLGIGDDGHTASLFPNTDALNEKNRWVVENFVPKFNSYRISFTYPLIEKSKEVLFLVNGKKKHEIAKKVINKDPKYPSSFIKSKKISWIIGA